MVSDLAASLQWYIDRHPSTGSWNSHQSAPSGSQ